MSNTVTYLEGSEKGYNAYRLYLAVDLHFKGKVPAIVERGGKLKPRLSKCKRSTYSSSSFMRLFERLAHKLSQEKLAMLFVGYQMDSECDKIYINNYNEEDVISFENRLRRLHYNVEQELRVIFQDLKNNGNDLFAGSPSRLTKMVFSGELSPEAYIYLSLLTKIPESNDMVTELVNKKIDLYRDWFLYFTDKDLVDHEKISHKMLQKLKKDL